MEKSIAQDFMIFLVGIIFTFISYFSVWPIIVASILFASGLLFIAVILRHGKSEILSFSRLFVLGFFSMGVGGIYVEIFGDVDQLFGDPEHFYQIAIGSLASMPIMDLATISEGSLAIKVWGSVYELFSVFGVPKERYVGILTNTTLVALSGAYGMRMIRIIYGNDPARINRFLNFCLFSGTLWLFSGLHMRDAFALFFTTLLTYTWVWYLSDIASRRRLLIIIVSTILMPFFGYYIRQEFFYVPYLLAGIGFTATLFSRTHSYKKISFTIFLVFPIILIGISLLINSITTAYENVTIGYQIQAQEKASSTSLGMYIVQTVLPLRTFLSLIYMYIYPIPVWIGFQLNSAYLLFKSINAVFFYFLIPLLVLSLGEIFTIIRKKNIQQLFLLSSLTVYSILIALTSLETRHLGAFYMTILIVSIMPDLAKKEIRTKYKKLFYITASLMTLIHLMWFVLKAT